MNNYERVIPRDFFNEAKLLKCMGRLALLILDGFIPDGMDINVWESGGPFEIVQDQDGNLSVKNYPVIIGGKTVYCYTLCNNQSPYPFCALIGDEEIRIFDAEGNFTEEFKSATCQKS